MNRAERIFRMHNLLRSKTPVTVQRLKDETGYSISTIKRDIEYMRDHMHPCLMLHYRGNGYLVAYCELKQALRSFSVDRISTPVKIDEPVRQIDDKQLQRCLHASFGIFADAAKAWAVLRFSALASRWVAGEQWHPDQIGQWHGREYELQIPYSYTREWLMEILKYGPEVEVLAPEGLRAEVGEKLRVAAEKYL